MGAGVFKLLSKAVGSLKNGGQIVNGVRQGEGTAHFLARHTLGTKTGKVIGWAGLGYTATALSGKGLISVGSGVADKILLDKEERGKGSIKGLYRQLADSSLGEGTADAIDKKAGEIAQGAVDGAKQVKDAAAGALGAGVDMVQGGVQKLTGNGQQPQYVDPNTGYYPQQTMMNGGISQFTAPFNSIPQMLGNMTGRNVTMTNLASLVASAYMMMGPFGWLGKIVSLLMGNMALKSMRQQPQMVYSPQQGYYPQQQQYQPAMMPPQQQVQEAQEDNAVFRRKM